LSIVSEIRITSLSPKPQMSTDGHG